MTQPRLAKLRTSANGPRLYPWPPQPPHEFEVLSVTTAIGQGYPKPFLIPWAAKVTAEAAVDNIEIVAQMVAKGDQKGAIDYLKQSRNRIMGSKADRGTLVHAALEAYVEGKPIDDAQLAHDLEEARVPKSMWRSTKGMIDGIMLFLQEEQPEILWSEATVFSREHEYAGTADLIAYVKIGDSRLPAVLDVKTSKSIYDDTAMQLAAYARADFVGLDDGSEVPLLEDGGSIDHGIVIRPMASGRYEKAIFNLTDDVFELFLHCLAIAKSRDVLPRSRRP